VAVLYDRGKRQAAVAIGRWDGEPVLAMRWNGTDDNVIGNPQSRGLPTWFIVPREFRLAVLDELSAWFLRRLYWHVSSSLTPWR
jgi:hypothetical protein